MLSQSEIMERNRLMLRALHGGTELMLGTMQLRIGLVHYTLDHAGFDTFAHRHRHYECSVLLSGRMRYRLEEEPGTEVVLEGGSGQWIMIAPELAHRRQALADNSLLLGFTLNFKNPPPSFLRAVKGKMRMLDGAAEREQVAEIAQETPGGPRFQAERLRLRLFELLLDFFADAFGSMFGEVPPSVRGGDILELADHYIEENLTRAITVDDISRHAGISRRHLYRLFEEKHGMPLKEYIIRQRLSRAAAALIGTDLPVKEIAGMAGFHNLSYFTRQFHRVFTMPPAKYRRLGR